MSYDIRSKPLRYLVFLIEKYNRTAKARGCAMADPKDNTQPNKKQVHQQSH